jgi:hypothetical protein
MSRRTKRAPRFKNLRALISAWAEGALSRKELDTCLQAVEMGVGLSKRDAALGLAMEHTDDDRDSPVYWDGFRAGLVQGYEGARLETEGGGTLRPVAELAAEAESEAKAEAAAKGEAAN